MTSTDWNVVYTAPQCEDVAARWLKRRGFEFFAPSWLYRGRRRGKTYLSGRPLFPRYIFVAYAPTRYSELEETIGVAGLVRTNGLPVLLPNRIIAELQAAVASGRFVQVKAGDKFPRRLRPGEQIARNEGFRVGSMKVVEGGPFASHIVVILRAPENERIDVLMDICGRKTVINLPTSDLAA